MAATHDEDDENLGTPDLAKVNTSVSQSIARAEEIGAMMLDEAYESSNSRLRGLGITPEIIPDVGRDRLVSMGRIVFAANGGSLRTFSGGLPHECGWWPAAKNPRVQHWEGIAAYNFMLESECNHDVDWAQSEGIGFRVFLDRKWRGYVADFDLRVAGRRHVIEVKRTERDLQDPAYRMKLAAVAEICRRCGWIFRIVLADEIFATRHHRDNCERFVMRRFLRVTKQQLDNVENHALRNGPETTYGELAAAIAPRSYQAGEAVIQALTLRRRLRIDLTQRVYARTPVQIL
jgi:hypothetical protein